MRRYVIANYSR